MAQQEVFQHQLRDDLLYITHKLGDFATTTFNSSTTPSLPIKANSAWMGGAQRFFVDVERLGPAKLVDSLMERMSPEVRVLLGMRTYTAQGLAKLPSDDLIKGGIYVDIIQGIDTSVDARFTSTSGVYTGSAVRLATRLTKYKNVKEGLSSGDKEARRSHLLAATSSEATTMDSRPLIIFEDNEVGTPLFVVSEGLMMILLRSVTDTGFWNSWVTDESLELFEHCVPSTLQSPSYHGLNTARAMKQGIPKLRSKKVAYANVHCGVTREEKKTVFSCAKAGSLPLASYWCRACSLHYYNYGVVRPLRVILKRKTPKPTHCPTCGDPVSATSKEWTWNDKNNNWRCNKCYKNAHKVSTPRTQVRESYLKPAVCPGCRRPPEDFHGNRGWTFDHAYRIWWCFGCSPSKGSKTGVKEKQKKNDKPKSCPHCRRFKTSKGGDLAFNWLKEENQWVCRICWRNFH